MSVTLASKPTDHELQHHRTLAEIAAEAVFENRAVCDECFARVRTDDGERAFSGTVGFDVDEKDAYGAIERHESRTTCGECGSIGCDRLETTLSTQTAVDRVQRLARRLEDAGHDPDRDVMYHVIREGKSREQLAGRDDDLFALAAKLGLRQGTVDR